MSGSATDKDVQINETFFEDDGTPYGANRIDRTLMLGGVAEWTLRSNFVRHPFHTT